MLKLFICVSRMETNPKNNYNTCPRISRFNNRKSIEIEEFNSVVCVHGKNGIILNHNG